MRWCTSARFFVDGQDGAQLLAEWYRAGMPQELDSAIITEVAAALDDAHKRGLLQRDVKLADIILANLDDERERPILLSADDSPDWRMGTDRQTPR